MWLRPLRLKCNADDETVTLMPDESSTIRRTVLFSGRVQGVGFRFTAQSLAADFSVTGYVRNLPDGRVELVAEGRRDELDRFVAAIQRTMRENITSVEVRDEPAQGGFESFTIRY